MSQVKEPPQAEPDTMMGPAYPTAPSPTGDDPPAPTPTPQPAPEPKAPVKSQDAGGDPDPFAVVEDPPKGAPKAPPAADPSSNNDPRDWRFLDEVLQSDKITNEHFKTLAAKSKAEIEQARKDAEAAQAKLKELESSPKLPEDFDPEWKSKLDMTAKEKAEWEKKAQDASKRLAILDLENDPEFDSKYGTKTEMGEATEIAKGLGISNADATVNSLLNKRGAERIAAFTQLRKQASENGHSLDGWGLEKLERVLSRIDEKRDGAQQALENVEEARIKLNEQRTQQMQQQAQKQLQMIDYLRDDAIRAQFTERAQDYKMLYGRPGEEKGSTIGDEIRGLVNQSLNQVEWSDPAKAVPMIVEGQFARAELGHWQAVAARLATQVNDMRKLLEKSGGNPSGGAPNLGGGNNSGGGDGYDFAGPQYPTAPKP